MSKYFFWAIYLLVLGSYLLSHTETLQLEERIHKLEVQHEVDKDLADGMDRHLQFVDSDHAKLGRDITEVRQDLDNHRFHHEYVEER